MIQKRIPSPITMQMKIWKSKEWTGMRWNAKQLQMIEGGKEMAVMKRNAPVLRERIVVVDTNHTCHIYHMTSKYHLMGCLDM